MTMRTTSISRRWALAALGSLPWLARAARAEAIFDLSPEQPGRLRGQPVAAATGLIPKDFPFVRPGTLTVAIAPGGPPLAAYATDARTVVGADPDFAVLLADSLALKLDLQPVAWADWPLGLTSGKYDAVISNVGVTEERKLKFDFATYRKGLHGIDVRSDSPIASIKGPEDAAGLRVIVGAGTNQEHILLEWSRINQAAGRKPLDLQYYDDQPSALLAIASGRADVIVQPHAQLIYIAANQGHLKQVGTLSAGWPARSDVAVTTRKGNGLVYAVSAATNALIASGLYGKALARWSLADEALDRSEVNPPGLPKF
jgi:polar amino acid transport system substrate-binding protein